MAFALERRGQRVTMATGNYWLHLNDRRMSRRAALRGASGMGVAAALSAAACGGGDDSGEPTAEVTAPPEKVEEVKSILWQRTDTTAQAVPGSVYQAYTTADTTNLDPRRRSTFCCSAFCRTCSR